jgi:hypothetical protein
MRAATLLAIIPDFVNLNVVTPINCQVGSASYVCVITFTPRLDNPKAWMTFELVGKRLI